MSVALDFTKSDALTMGVELELQIVDRRTGDLTRGASDLIHLIERKPYPGDIKPEITESMVEISTKVHTRFGPLRDELRAIRDTLVPAADRLDLEIAGGGAHPFQRWHERQIFDRPRFRHVAGLYGYLAKQFTVFGQHVHIGCTSGDAAMRLLHSLARYVPHFIALSACSPYYQGVDTAFDCSRLNTVFAFPLSGRAPFVTDWAGFEAYFAKMRRLGVVESMKDFYWDIRPKPEYGTIEVRVFDTPLTVDRAAELAGYLQAVCAMLSDTGAPPESEDIYLTYSYNRFQACRFGLEAQLIDVASGAAIPLHRDVLDTVERCRPYAQRLECTEALDAIEALVRAHGNHARWQRETYQQSRSLAEVVLRSASLWSGRTR
ncbi:MAG: YbdK family carboxylate-amine ligase [Pseudomonadota bacterium]